MKKQFLIFLKYPNFNLFFTRITTGVAPRGPESLPEWHPEASNHHRSGAQGPRITTRVAPSGLISIAKAMLILLIFLPYNLKALYDYLDFSGSVKSFILQNSGVSIISGPSSSLINPAGLAGYNKNWVSVSHLNWIFDFKLEYLEAGYSLNKNITFAGYIDYFTTKSFDFINKAGEKESSLHYYDLLAGIAAGIKLGKFNFGINTKILHTEIKYSGTGFSSDIGMKYPYSGKKLNFGICIKNLISKKVILDKSGNQMKIHVLGGINYRLSEVINISMSLRSDSQYNVSTSLNIKEQFELYSGYSFGNMDSWGLGMSYSFLSPQSIKTFELGILKPTNDLDVTDFPLRIGFKYEY